MLSGRPIVCVERIAKGSPPLKRRLKFSVESMDDTVGITLRGIISTPQYISGSPRTVREIVKLQDLEIPFGRADHHKAEKVLPVVPGKR